MQDRGHCDRKLISPRFAGQAKATPYGRGRLLAPGNRLPGSPPRERVRVEREERDLIASVGVHYPSFGKPPSALVKRIFVPSGDQVGSSVLLRSGLAVSCVLPVPSAFITQT